MSKTPLDLTFEDLVDAARTASLRADQEARDAGLEVAGLTGTMLKQGVARRTKATMLRGAGGEAIARGARRA